VPTFQDLLARTRIELGFVLRVAGVPKLFASFARPKAAWSTVDGETYAWVECIDSSEIADAEETIDALTGLPAPGQLSLQLRLVPDVLAMVDIEAAALHTCTLTDDTAATDTTINVDDTTGMLSAGTLQIAAEGIDYTGKTASSFTGCTRGAYGSRARRYQASFASVQRFGVGGPLASNLPLTLAGRHCDLWIVQMRRVDGVRVAYGTALDDAEHTRLRRGPLLSATPDYAQGVAAFVIASKAAVLDVEIMTQQPTATLGHGIADAVQIDVDSCRIAFQLQYYAADPVLVRREGRLQRDTWSGGAWTGTPEDVPFGVYSAADVGRWIAFTVEQLIDAATVTCWGGYYASTRQLVLFVRITGSSVVTPNLQLVWQPTTDSLIDEMRIGTSEDETVETLDSSVWVVQSTWTADEALPVARLTARGLRRVYYHGAAELDFVAAPGWQTDDGADAPACVKIGGELCEFSSKSTVSFGVATLRYLQLSRRGCYGSQASEQVLTADDDPIEISQCFAMPRTSVGRALLYLAQSDGGGSDYDQGWQGSGAGLAAADFDDASFEAVAALRDVCVISRRTLRDVAAALCPQTQTAIVPSRAGALRLVDLDPITEDEIETATALVLDDFAGAPSFDPGEDRIVNLIEGQNLGFDSALEKGESYPVAQGTSGGTYGYKSAVPIDMRWSGPIDAGKAALFGAFDRIVSKFGTRFATVAGELIAAVKAWSIDPLDPVTLTHPMLPDGAGGYGMIGRLARLWTVRRVYQSSGSPRASIVAVVHDLDRSAARCRLAPSARSSAVSGSTITIDPDTYSAGELADDANFLAGMKVRISTPGTTTAVSRTIASVSGGDIVLTAAVGLAHPVIVEFDGWSLATAAQQRYAFIGQSKRWS